MNRLRAWIRNVLGFSRSESNAFIILLPLMMVIIFSEPVYRWWFASQPIDYSKEVIYLDSVVATMNGPQTDSVEVPYHFFKFNPNTATVQDFESLGLSKFLVQRIVNYRGKGGKFKIKSDVQKIYGMDSIWYQKAYAYINLPEKKETSDYPKEYAKEQKPIIAERREVARFDLNQADTTQLIKLYGIGPKLALRIVKYRDKLGGFVQMNQLREVYGLDSIVISRIAEKTFIDRNFTPVRLSINQADEKQLAAHPYLNWKIAKAITTYRFQHGSFKSVDELTQIKIIEEQVLQRVKPYFTAD